MAETKISKKKLKRTRVKNNPWKDVEPTPSYHEDDKGKIVLHKKEKRGDALGSKYSQFLKPKELAIARLNYRENIEDGKRAMAKSKGLLYFPKSNNRKETRRRRNRTNNKIVRPRQLDVQRIPVEVKIPVKVKGKSDVLRIKLNRFIKLQHIKVG